MSEFCEWHIIVVEEDQEDDPEITVMHPPSCPFVVSVHPGNQVEFQHNCIIHYEIDGVGYDTLLPVDMRQPGMYRTRMRHYRAGYGEFSEIDTEWETEPLAVKPEDDLVFLLKHIMGLVDSPATDWSYIYLGTDNPFFVKAREVITKS